MKCIFNFGEVDACAATPGDCVVPIIPALLHAPVAPAVVGVHTESGEDENAFSMDYTTVDMPSELANRRVAHEKQSKDKLRDLFTEGRTQRAQQATVQSYSELFGEKPSERELRVANDVGIKAAADFPIPNGPFVLPDGSVISNVDENANGPQATRIPLDLETELRVSSANVAQLVASTSEAAGSSQSDRRLSDDDFGRLKDAAVHAIRIYTEENGSVPDGSMLRFYVSMDDRFRSIFEKMEIVVYLGMDYDSGEYKSEEFYDADRVPDTPPISKLKLEFSMVSNLSAEIANLADYFTENQDMIKFYQDAVKVHRKNMHYLIDQVKEYHSSGEGGGVLPWDTLKQKKEWKWLVGTEQTQDFETWNTIRLKQVSLEVYENAAVLTGRDESDWGAKFVFVDGPHEADLVQECNRLFDKSVPARDHNARLERMKQWFASYKKLTIMRKYAKEFPNWCIMKYESSKTKMRYARVKNEPLVKQLEKLTKDRVEVVAQLDKDCSDERVQQAQDALRSFRKRRPGQMVLDKSEADKSEAYEALVVKCDALRRKLLEVRLATCQLENAIAANETEYEDYKKLADRYKQHLRRLRDASGSNVDGVVDTAEKQQNKTQRGSNVVTPENRSNAAANKQAKDERQAARLYYLNKGELSKEAVLKDEQCDKFLQNAYKWERKRMESTQGYTKVVRARQAWIDNEINNNLYLLETNLSEVDNEYRSVLNGNSLTTDPGQRDTRLEKLKSLNENLNNELVAEKKAQEDLKKAREELSDLRGKVANYARASVAKANLEQIRTAIDTVEGESELLKLNTEAARQSARLIFLGTELKDKDFVEIGATNFDRSQLEKTVIQLEAKCDSLAARTKEMRENAEVVYTELVAIENAYKEPPPPGEPLDKNIQDRLSQLRAKRSLLKDESAKRAVVLLNLKKLSAYKTIDKIPPEYRNVPELRATIEHANTNSARNLIASLRQVVDNCDQTDVDQLMSTIRNNNNTTPAIEEIYEKSRRTQSIEIKDPEVTASFKEKRRSFKEEITVRVEAAAKAKERQRISDEYLELMAGLVDQIVILSQAGSPRGVHYYGLLCSILQGVSGQDFQCENKSFDAPLSELVVGLGTMQTSHPGEFGRTVSLLTKWASLRLECRGGAWPPPEVAADLAKSAADDGYGNRPIVDEQTGEVMLYTLEDVRAVEEDGDSNNLDVSGRRRGYPNSCVAWAKLDSDTYAPMDSFLYVVRKPQGSTQWQLHKTFTDLVNDELAKTFQKDKLPRVGAEFSAAQITVQNYTLYRPTNPLLKGSPREVSERDILLDDRGWKTAVDLQRKQCYELKQQELRYYQVVDRIENQKKMMTSELNHTEGPLMCSEETYAVQVGARIAKLEKSVEHNRNKLSAVQTKLKSVLASHMHSRTQRFRDTVGIPMREPVQSIGALRRDYLQDLSWLNDAVKLKNAAEAISTWISMYYGWGVPTVSTADDLKERVLPWLSLLKSHEWPYPRLVSPKFEIAEAEFSYRSLGPPPSGAPPPTEAWKMKHPTWQYAMESELGSTGASKTRTHNALLVGCYDMYYTPPDGAVYTETDSANRKPTEVTNLSIEHQSQSLGFGQPALQKGKLGMVSDISQFSESAEDVQRRMLDAKAAQMAQNCSTSAASTSGSYIETVINTASGPVLCSTTAADAPASMLGKIYSGLNAAQSGTGSAVVRTSDEGRTGTVTNVAYRQPDQLSDAERKRAGKQRVYQIAHELTNDPMDEQEDSGDPMSLGSAYIGCGFEDSEDDSSENDTDDLAVATTTVGFSRLCAFDTGALRAPRRPCGLAIAPRPLEPLPVLVS